MLEVIEIKIVAQSGPLWQKSTNSIHPCSWYQKVSMTPQESTKGLLHSPPLHKGNSAVTPSKVMLAQPWAYNGLSVFFFPASASWTCCCLVTETWAVSCSIGSIRRGGVFLVPLPLSLVPLPRSCLTELFASKDRKEGHKDVGRDPFLQVVCHLLVHQPARKLLFVTWDFIQNYTNDLLKWGFWKLHWQQPLSPWNHKLFLKCHLGSMG